MKYILTILISIFFVSACFANEPEQNTLLSNAQKLNNIQNNMTQNVGIGGKNLLDTQKIKVEINKALQKRFPEAEVVSFSQIPKNGTIIYDCDVSYQDSIVKLYINPDNGAISGRIDDKELLLENITQRKINNGTKEVNNVLKQMMLDASFENVQYNKKNKTMEGNIFYTGNKYYFKMNLMTGEIIEMKPIE